MNRQDAAMVLRAWEAGTAAPPVARGAAVVAVLGAVEASVLDQPLPMLAAAAATCHAEAFGADLEGLVTCPACAAQLEVTVRLTDRVGEPSGDPGPSALPASGLVVRVPTTRDLMAVAGRPDGRDVLLARCVTAADGQPVDASKLTTEEVGEIDDWLEDAAGAALPVVRTVCPDCGAGVAGCVDAVALLWQRVEGAVPGLLADVARLAAAFGWHEDEILSMSPARRAAYLGLAAT